MKRKDKYLKQKIELAKGWIESPITRHYSFFDSRLWAKQEEVLWSVRNNPKTCVKSGNTVGKTHIAADVVLDYLTIHKPAKVITTAPTWTQVEDILWKEIASSVGKSKIRIKGDLLKTSLRLSDDWFAMGISTNERQRFQGFHSPNLLVVIDEAGGVAPEIFEAIEGLHPHRVLAIGNPLEPSGCFYDSFQSSFWNKITIDCRECVKWQKENGEIPGLVTQRWIDERIEEWGANNPLTQGRVFGEFPEEGENTLIRRSWVERARKGLDIDDMPLREEHEADKLRICSCDVATKHGFNETVIQYRYGHTIPYIKAYQQISATKTRDEIAWLYHDKKLNSVVADADGVGENIGEFLAQERIRCMDFHGGYGQKAFENNTYKNLRTQFYCIAALKFQKGLYNLSQLPQKEYDILKNQLCSIQVKRPDAMGRQVIESKEDMMARGIKSPDYADAFMMAEYGYYMGNMAEVKPYAWR